MQIHAYICLWHVPYVLALNTYVFGDLEPFVGNVRDHHRRRSEGLGDHHAHQTDRPGAEDGHLLTRLRRVVPSRIVSRRVMSCHVPHTKKNKMFRERSSTGEGRVKEHSKTYILRTCLTACCYMYVARGEKSYRSWVENKT